MICHIYLRERKMKPNGADGYIVSKLMSSKVLDEYVWAWRNEPLVTLMSQPDYFGKSQKMTLKVVQRTILFDGEELLVVGEKMGI